MPYIAWLIMTLAELHKGQKARIVSIHDEELALKFFEMGLLPGELIEVENIAPFGDPIALRLEESKIGLRLHEAALVEITPEK